MRKKAGFNVLHITGLFFISLFFSFHLMTGSAEFIEIIKNNFNYAAEPVFFVKLACITAVLWILMMVLSYFSGTEETRKNDRYIIIAAVFLLAADVAMSYIKYSDRNWLALYGMLFAVAVFLLWKNNRVFSDEVENHDGKLIPLLLSVTAVCIAALAITRAFSFHDAFFTMAKDMGVLVNSIWRVGEDGTQFTYFDGYRDQRGAHFQPVIYLFAALFKYACYPKLLLFTQVVFSVSAVFFLYLLADRLINSKKASFFLSLAYLVSIYTARTFVYDFHFDSMYMMFFFAFLFFGETRRFWPAAAALCLALTVKEEAALYMMTSSVFVFIRTKEKKYLCLAGLAAVYAAAVIGLLIPSYGYQNGTFADQVIYNLTSGMKNYLSKDTAVQLIVFFSGAALLPFLALAAMLLLLIPPVVVHTSMYMNRDFFLFDLQYASFVVPPLFASVVYALSKKITFSGEPENNIAMASFFVFLLQAQIHLSYMLEESLIYKASASIFTAVMAVLAFSSGAKTYIKYAVITALAVFVFFAGYFKHYEWRQNLVPVDHRESIRKAMNLIPDDKETALVANTNIVPHLCCRKYVFALELSTPEEILAYLSKENLNEFYILIYLKDFTYEGINPGDRTARLFALAEKMGYKMEPFYADGITAAARLSR